ncbi:MAG: flagellar protein FlaG [Limnohabitans sp.]
MTNISSALHQASAPHLTPASTAAPVESAAAPAKAEPAVPKSNIPKVDPIAMRKKLQEAIEQLNAEMKRSNQELRFSMDNVLDMPVVTVRNSTTGDVVRQIPNETTIRVAHNVDKLKGVLFSDEA